MRVATFLVSTSNRNLLVDISMIVTVATFLVSTSNRNYALSKPMAVMLLHFLFLHQTATQKSELSFVDSCYISCFYIKPQPNNSTPRDAFVATFLVSTSNRNKSSSKSSSKKLLHFLFLHQTATDYFNIYMLCRLLHFLFLHQTATVLPFLLGTGSLLHFLFLHQTATSKRELSTLWGCYISCFYIKPQHVDYYCPAEAVATFLVSTSNRNATTLLRSITRLLHFLFLHQTATWYSTFDPVTGCYISCFYIKPQPIHFILLYLKEISNKKP